MRKPKQLLAKLNVRDHLLFWIPLAVVTAPLVYFAIRLIASGWVLHGDEAIIAIKAHDAWTGHLPLLGMRSTSDVTSPGVWAHHPGPIEFWLIGLPYLLTGFHPAGLIIGSLLIAIGFSGVSLWSAYRAADRLGVAIMAFAIFGMIALFGDSLVLPWNPWPPVLGMLAMLAVGWRIMLGDRGLWPLYVFCASFVGQAHLSLLPIAVIVSGFLLGRTVWLWRRSRPRVVRRRELRWALGVGLLCWLGPLIDFLTFSPNNVSEIWRLSGSEDGTAKGRREGFVHFTYMLFPWDQRFRHDLEVGQLGVAVLILTAAILFMSWRMNRSRKMFGDGRDLITPALKLTTVAVLVIWWAGRKTPGGLRVIYLDFAIASTVLHTVLVLVWLALAILAAAKARRIAVPSAVVGTVAAFAAVIGLVAMPEALARIFTQQQYAQDNRQSALVLEAVNKVMAEPRMTDQPVTVQGFGLVSWLGVGPAISADLVAQGRDVYFDTSWAHREDDSFRRRSNLTGMRVSIVVSERPPGGDWSFATEQKPVDEIIVDKLDDGGQMRVQFFLGEQDPEEIPQGARAEHAESDTPEK